MPETKASPKERIQTVRQQVFELLCAAPCSCRDLSQAVSQSENEILDHLEHLRKSLRHEDCRLIIEPSVCRKCGFTFKERQRLAKPGKCPSCKHSVINPPVFFISRD